MYTHPGYIIVVILAITVFFAMQLSEMELDNNNFRFVPENDPARIDAEAIDEDFGSQVQILVGIERPFDSVFDSGFLERMRQFDQRLASLENVDEVTSIVSTDFITAQGDSIVVESIVPDSFSGSPEEIEEIKKRVRSWDLYDRVLISEDERSTQMLVSLDLQSDEAGGEESLAVLKEIRTISQEIFNDGSTVYFAGLPVFSSDINSAMKADLRTLIPLVIITVLVILLISFRRAIAIILPLTTVVIATIWSIGAMPLFGIRLSILSTVLPVILVAVGSAYGIHVVTHYLDDCAGKKNMTKEEHNQLVMKVIQTIGKPVALASLTTFVGFVSFCFTSVLPIREFGYFSSFGVIVSFVVSITFIPAVLLLRGPKPLKQHSEIKANGKDPLADAIAHTFTAVTRKKRAVVLLSVILGIFSVSSIPDLVIDNALVEYFRGDADVARSDRFIRSEFAGTKTVNIIVRAADTLTLLHPDVLSAMDGLSSYLEQEVPNVGKVMGFTDLIKRINQVYNADEDPSGIRPAVASGAAFSRDDQTFGFDEADDGDFGFGDFGSFPVETDPASSVEHSDPSPENGGASVGEEQVTRTELIASLDGILQRNRTQETSVRELVKELKKSVNFEGAAYYEIPSDPERYGKETKEELASLISNYLVLLSGDIGSYANDPLEPTAIRMSVQLRTTGQIDTDAAIALIDDYVQAKFPPTVSVSTGGLTFVERSLNQLVVQSQLVSVIISIAMVFLILSVSWGSVWAGLIGIAPLAISILFNFAVMAATGIKLNIGTALVASLAVGIGIDYTIHYLAAYNREYVAHNGADGFLWRTFITSGKAIMINAVSVGCGFAVLILSGFNMLAQFGFLIALTMLSSSIVALTVLPVLLNWIQPEFIRKERNYEKSN